MGSLNIGFTSPQGGSGVSTLTLAIASRLHYYHNINVRVADCDTRKYSCFGLRTREKKDGNQQYEIVKTDCESLDAKNITIFDLGGNMESDVWSKMNYVYIPIVASHMVGASIETVMKVADKLFAENSRTQIRMFLNKCRPTKDTRLFDIFSDAGITPSDNVLVTETRIYKRQRFETNEFRDGSAISTVKTVDFEFMKRSGLYFLEQHIIRDIERAGLWKRH